MYVSWVLIHAVCPYCRRCQAETNAVAARAVTDKHTDRHTKQVLYKGAKVQRFMKFAPNVRAYMIF